MIAVAAARNLRRLLRTELPDEPTETDFETFLRRWTDERIWAVEDFLDDEDRRYMEERRALELIMQAKEKGFRDELTNLAKSHGSVLQYVKHLFFKASIEGRTGRTGGPK